MLLLITCWITLLGVLCKLRKTNLIIFNQTYIKLLLRLNILICVLCFHIMIEFSNEIHSILIWVAAKVFSQLWPYKLKWLHLKKKKKQRAFSLSTRERSWCTTYLNIFCTIQFIYLTLQEATLVWNKPRLCRTQPTFKLNPGLQISAHHVPSILIKSKSEVPSATSVNIKAMTKRVCWPEATDCGVKTHLTGFSHSIFSQSVFSVLSTVVLHDPFAKMAYFFLIVFSMKAFW